MKDTFYLIMNAKGVKKLHKRMPKIERDEIAIALTLTVPDTVFEQYVPQAKLEVPEEAALGSRVNVKIISNFPTEKLIEVEEEIIAELLTRDDCPDDIAKLKETQ
jgi:hypothetical protein